jgi:sulfur carrier protein
MIGEPGCRSRYRGRLRSYPLNLIRIMPAQGADELRVRLSCRDAFFFCLKRSRAMKLVVNGETHETTDDASVEGLLAEMGVAPRTVVVALNDEVLAAASRGKRQLREGDRIELFRFVGGG